MTYIVRWNKKIVDGKELPVTEEEIYEVYSGKKEIQASKEELDKYIYDFDKEKVRELTLKLTARKLRESIGDDQKIIVAISTVKDLDEIINKLMERLREFYGLYFPEIIDNEELLDLIEMDKEKVLASLGIKESIGAKFDEDDLKVARNLAKRIKELKAQREELLNYIEKKITKLMPNFVHLATVKIAADFLEHSGSIERLAKFPASTIQVLGAEKALFIHLMKGTKPPKYGILYNHPLIRKLPYKQKGKAARALATKLAIAVKLDYANLVEGKNKFIADKLKEQLVKRFGVNW